MQPEPRIVDLLALGLMFFGLIGSVLPVLPGPLLIWLGAFLWAWAHGFDAVGWPTLLLLGVLTMVAWGSDLLLTLLIGRKIGTSWKALFGAIAGGLIGGIFFGGWIPVIGTVVATIAGGVIGIVLVEYVDKRNWQAAWRASKGFIASFALSNALEATLAILMIVIFVWQAYF